MNKRKHTAEPWEFGINGIGKVFTNSITSKYSEDDVCEGYSGPSGIDCARIIECVNAMQGIEDPAEWMKEHDPNHIVTHLGCITRFIDLIINKSNWVGGKWSADFNLDALARQAKDAANSLALFPTQQSKGGE